MVNSSSSGLHHLHTEFSTRERTGSLRALFLKCEECFTRYERNPLYCIPVEEHCEQFVSQHKIHDCSVLETDSPEATENHSQGSKTKGTFTSNENALIHCKYSLIPSYVGTPTDSFFLRGHRSFLKHTVCGAERFKKLLDLLLDLFCEVNNRPRQEDTTALLLVIFLSFFQLSFPGTDVESTYSNSSTGSEARETMNRTFALFTGLIAGATTPSRLADMLTLIFDERKVQEILVPRLKVLYDDFFIENVLGLSRKIYGKMVLDWIHHMVNSVGQGKKQNTNGQKSTTTSAVPRNTLKNSQKSNSSSAKRTNVVIHFQDRNQMGPERREQSENVRNEAHIVKDHLPHNKPVHRNNRTSSVSSEDTASPLLFSRRNSRTNFTKSVVPGGFQSQKRIGRVVLEMLEEEHRRAQPDPSLHGRPSPRTVHNLISRTAPLDKIRPTRTSIKHEELAHAHRREDSNHSERVQTASCAYLGNENVRLEGEMDTCDARVRLSHSKHKGQVSNDSCLGKRREEFLIQSQSHASDIRADVALRNSTRVKKMERRVAKLRIANRLLRESLAQGVRTAHETILEQRREAAASLRLASQAASIQHSKMLTEELKKNARVVAHVMDAVHMPPHYHTGILGEKVLGRIFVRPHDRTTTSNAGTLCDMSWVEMKQQLQESHSRRVEELNSLHDKILNEHDRDRVVHDQLMEHVDKMRKMATIRREVARTERLRKEHERACAKEAQEIERMRCAKQRLDALREQKLREDEEQKQQERNRRLMHQLLATDSKAMEERRWKDKERGDCHHASRRQQERCLEADRNAQISRRQREIIENNISEVEKMRCAKRSGMQLNVH